MDRIERRLIARMRAKRGIVRIAGDGVTVVSRTSREHHSFGNLTAAFVWQSDGYVGTEIRLRLEFHPEESVEVGESDPGWTALLGALDSSDRLLLRSHEWLVAVIAGGAGGPAISIGVR